MEKVHALLTPFTIICLSSDAGLVELIPDAVSIHTVKKRTPDFRSLRDFFERAFGPVTSSRFVAAQKRFIQSLAGYSLVQYFMQVRSLDSLIENYPTPLWAFLTFACFRF
mmetsp:Transcript_25240/g.99631  ORF Transcript_25240/g.99631 Transcript_25240/m.99631 type:complete len:110 (-) Transcript_25240:670-999(-)